MWLAASLLFLAVCLYLYLDTVKPKKFPPGPRWLPIIGCAYQVYKLRARTGYLYETLRELSTACNNASLLGLRMGKNRIVMINSLEANKEMLCSEDFNGRPKGIIYEARTMGKRQGILFADGELWKERKKFLLKHLKEFGFGRRDMENIIISEASHMMNDVVEMINNNCKSAEIMMHKFFNVYVLNTLWTMIAGRRYKPSEPQIILLQTLVSDLLTEVDMIGSAFSHFPVLATLAPTLSGYRRFNKIHLKIWKFLRDELTRHKENFDPKKEDSDYMDAYIRVMWESGEGYTYSEEQLLAECMDLFMAGSETTNNSLSFCFTYLVREQEIQKKAQEEIDRVVGQKRLPCIEDRPNMPYNDAIVYESIRHFTGRGLGIPHRAMRDTTLAGYCIPEVTLM